MSVIKSIKIQNEKVNINDARISDNDITNWNGKTSNVGTVVGIQMNGGSTIFPDVDGIIDLGTLITSHQSISGKADKVSNPTSGNFAGLDSNGNLTDSGSKASDFATASSVTTIEGKIPTQASSSNQLADKNFVNSSISTATATFQGTYNLVNDLSLTTSATESGIAIALATAVSSADSNDYVFVLVPTADGTPTEISHVDRYKYNGTAWAYEYTLNNSSFTSAQWAAINSGITSSIVSAISDKYELPSGGIPATDLATAVQTSLGLADTAVQPSALDDYVTLATDQNITGVKTFLGQKKIAFKQATSSDKLGFTLFANDGTEKGYLEFNGSNKVDNIPLMTLGNYAQATAGLTQIGFRKYSSISGASGAYNLIAPLISDARTPFSLTTTYTNFYLPLGFTDGTTTVKTAKTGVVDLSSLLPDISGKADAATTLAGYGITDAKIENGVITLGSNSITPLTSHQDLTNYIQKSNTAGLVKNDGTIDTSTYNLAPLVIEINEDDYIVSSGTYTNITAALVIGKQIILKITLTDETIEYCPLIFDQSANENDQKYNFGNKNIDAYIDSNDECGWDYKSPNTHNHGRITPDGWIQGVATDIANNDRLVIADASATRSDTITKSSIKFDGSTTTQALTKKGTWETFLQTAPVTSVNGQTGAVSLTIPDDSTLLHVGTGDVVTETGIMINQFDIVDAYISGGTITNTVDVWGTLHIDDDDGYGEILLEDDAQTGFSQIVRKSGNSTETLQQALDARNNVKANWNETNTSSDAYIQNKPTVVETSTSGLKIEVVNALPASPDSNTIYIVQ